MSTRTVLVRDGRRATSEVVLSRADEPSPFPTCIARSKTRLALRLMRRHGQHSPNPFDKHLYKERHLVEFFFNRLKQYRRVATRYEKTARNFLGFVFLASSLLWLA